MRFWLAAALALTVAACATRSDDRETAQSPSREAPSPPAAPATPVAPPAGSTSASARPRIAVLGDSLTAGLGVAKAASYPSLLQERLDAAGLDFEVVNAGVSGDTSAGGLARLDWALDGDVRILIVALGGNDGLRGLPAEELQNNLAQIIERGQKRGIAVILAGMEAPPNYGRDYIVSFHRVYPALAAKYHVALVPFLLQGVAGDETLNQRDGIHPTAAGARIVADHVWAVLKPIAELRRQPTT
ncbi:MAG: arylesterase [Vicinamibacterales bacterium]